MSFTSYPTCFLSFFFFFSFCPSVHLRRPSYWSDKEQRLLFHICPRFPIVLLAPSSFVSLCFYLPNPAISTLASGEGFACLHGSLGAAVLDFLDEAMDGKVGTDCE